MSMQKQAIKELSDCCEICAGPVNSAIDLPNLPVTGIYSKSGPDPSFRSFDQEFLLCNQCGHGQLKYSIDPSYLYGSTYGFRTSKSDTASSGSIFFSNYIKHLFPAKKFKRIVEFGCNDAYLLRLIKDIGEKILGVDPIWESQKLDVEEKNIQVIGGMIEHVDFQEILGGKPDLIISQHTMEHVEHPKELLSLLLKLSDENTTFIFEFPCFDPLLEQIRFDQVFHQHLQYYSVRSFLTLLDILGAELIDFTFNYTYWGAILIAFKKTTSKSAKRNQQDFQGFPKKTVESVQERYSVFKNQMKECNYVLDGLNKDKLYGYGGALMLPILGYHLGRDFSDFKAIFDDDPNKDDLGYINLPVRIKNPENVDFKDLSICLTAMDNRRPIIKNLVEKGPRHIINPLNFI